MNIKRTEIKKALGFIIALFILLFNYSPAMQALRALPDIVYARENSESETVLNLPPPLFVKTEGDVRVGASTDESLTKKIYTGGAESGKIEIELFGLIPVKTIAVEVKPRPTLMIGGMSIGVAVHTHGVLVVGTSEILTDDGSMKSPAAAAGLIAGDVIILANGEETNDSSRLSGICNASNGNMTLTITRSGVQKIINFQAVLDSADNEYKMGLWVRDSTAGIGTLSFYDPNTLYYGALGHAIVDIDTGNIFEVNSGEIAHCNIVGIKRGERGTPGEIQGTFNKKSERLGSLTANSDFGITGKLYHELTNPFYPNGLPLAYPDEVRTGDATLYTTLDDNTVKAFSCRIIKLYSQNAPEAKGMVIEITDPELLSRTGGIIQGMSGSPLVQNGFLVGVVTHVLINEPMKGYCMYAVWMYDMFE
ncbi:MAG: SpoIVB peptidase [Clostridia bacterium]